MAEPARLETTVDPITLEIIRGSLGSAIRDMELLMERCAMSPFIKEKKDYFVGIFDTRGRIVACHISGSGPGMLQAIMKTYPLETMRPGDVYWFNDPYVSDGAVQHHQDMVFAVPIFHEGRLVGFATTFGHYQDIGGLRAGSISPHATEIYHEGVLVPPVRIVREGHLNEEAYRIFLRNSRLPDLVEGDTRAMMRRPRISSAFSPSHGRAGPERRPAVIRSSRIGFSRSIGTNMLPGDCDPAPAESLTISEPIPTSSPLALISAAPDQFITAG